MQRLIDPGFKKVGAWKLKDDGEIKYTLISNAETCNVVYCFVSEGKIKYVGKTANPFSLRLESYYKPGANKSTDIHVHERIIAQLNRNKAVTIWLLIDKGNLKFRKYTLNLADALEMVLIKNIEHKIWNKQGRYFLNEF
jgi:hypothetical protein